MMASVTRSLCSHQGERSTVFGHGGARHEAGRLGVPFLGEVPLDLAIRETSDAGRGGGDRSGRSQAAAYPVIAAKVRDQLVGRQGGARPAAKIVIEA
jgi:ATP-binding protein involved in chromosome partitioning